MMKVFGNLLFKIYNLIFSYLDSIKLKNKSFQYYNKGFKIFKIKNNFSFSNKNKEIKINRYLSKIIIKEKKIYEIIYNIFIKNDLKKKITKLTGLNYSIDYFVAYKTKKIRDKDLKLGWYANHWHKDKPFSKYFIKVIIPINKIDSQMGGIEILNSKKSKNQVNNFLKSDYKMISTNKKILVFSPNLCYHKAGSINNDKQRKQIMLQLNPSKKWCFNKRLYFLQKKKEPKFPYFSYFFSNKEEF